MYHENPQPRNKLINATFVLIAINIILYLITYQMNGMNNKMHELLGLYFPQNNHFRYWQFITHMFMHGNEIHLLFNMFALWSFGTLLEQIWGKTKFLFFYFLCGIGAGLIYTLVNYYQFNVIYYDLLNSGISSADIQNILDTKQYDPKILSTISEESLAKLYDIFRTQAMGASGALYGVLVAFAFLFPNGKLAMMFIPVPIAAKYFIPIIISIDLFSGITGFSLFGGGIGHFAHVGGALIGFLLMWYWKKGNLFRDTKAEE